MMKENKDLLPKQWEWYFYGDYCTINKYIYKTC